MPLMWPVAWSLASTIVPMPSASFGIWPARLATSSATSAIFFSSPPPDAARSPSEAISA